MLDGDRSMAMLRDQQDAEACLASARAALDALWTILDGVERRRLAIMN